MVRETSYLNETQNGFYKAKIDKQLLFITKLGYIEVNIISQQTITYSNSKIEILES